MIDESVYYITYELAQESDGVSEYRAVITQWLLFKMQ